MKIVQALQTLVCQTYKRDGIFAALKIAWKIHNYISFLKNIYSFFPLNSLQKRIAYTPSHVDESGENAEERREVENLEAVKIELLPFYDSGEAITSEKIHKFVETFNQRYFNYFIDPEENLLIGIRTRKLQMIIKGENVYIQGVEERARAFKPGFQVYIIVHAQQKDPLIQKIKIYSQDRLAMREDIPYQQTMLEHFCEWYNTVTAPLALPASAARYIT
ncbi:MAG: hypothetical protein KFB93_05395 [Simkaniaceae bacterium]|nr:MAG: hypothetical protein KFB93_05395 [Simkaniaceae bacterium]